MVAKGKTHIDHQVRGLLCTLYRVGRHWDNLPVGVENSSARRLASNGLVKNGRKILTLLERSVESGDGDYSSGSLDLG